MDRNKIVTAAKFRNSSIELLRIILMFMIMSLHSFKWTMTDCTLESLTVMRFMDFFREGLCLAAVDTFVLISGYYGIKFKVKTLGSLIFQIFFYIFLAYFIITLATGWGGVSELVHRLNGLYEGYWFMACYIGLYLISPVLNQYIEHVEKKDLLKLTTIFFILSLYFSLNNSNEFKSGSTILSFVLLYFIGRTIKMYDLPNLIKTRYCIISYIILAISICILGCVMMKYHHCSYANQKIWRVYCFGNNNPLIILEAICLMISFLKFNFHSKLINSIASSSLAIYLFHMAPDFKNYWINFACKLYDTDIVMHIASLFTLIMATFLVAIMVDRIRLSLWGIINKSITSR